MERSSSQRCCLHQECCPLISPHTRSGTAALSAWAVLRSQHIFRLAFCGGFLCALSVSVAWGVGLSHRNLRGHEWFLILCCLNKKIFTYKVAIICCLPLMCYILFVHKSSHFYTPIICINSESVLVFSGHTDRIKTRMKYK